MKSRLAGKGPRVYSDNAGVVRFLRRTIESLLYKEFAAESLPVIDATFERTGDSLSTVEGRVGKPTSSCCLAWSETWTKPRG